MSLAQDLREILSVTAEATKIERERCLQAVDDEPELPGDMPDEMWEAIAGDRDATAEAMRVVVRQTKAGIRERIIGEFVSGSLLNCAVADMTPHRTRYERTEK